MWPLSTALNICERNEICLTKFFQLMPLIMSAESPSPFILLSQNSCHACVMLARGNTNFLCQTKVFRSGEEKTNFRWWRVRQSGAAIVIAFAWCDTNIDDLLHLVFQILMINANSISHLLLLVRLSFWGATTMRRVRKNCVYEFFKNVMTVVEWEVIFTTVDLELNNMEMQLFQGIPSAKARLTNR